MGSIGVANRSCNGRFNRHSFIDLEKGALSSIWRTEFAQIDAEMAGLCSSGRALRFVFFDVRFNADGNHFR